MKYIPLLLVFLMACSEKEPAVIVQLTRELSKNFDLDNNDNFSPDDKWLCYDTRTESGGIGGCKSIEMVNIEIANEIISEIARGGKEKTSTFAVFRVVLL